jgi:hypothetical protein
LTQARLLLADLAADASRLAADATPGSDSGDRALGLHAGVSAARAGESTGLGLRPNGSEMYCAGFLAGHLQASLARARGSIDAELFLICAAYGAALATTTARTADSPEESLIRLHFIASILVLRRGAELSDDDESALFDWLARRLGIPNTDRLAASYERLRTRRAERLRGAAGPAARPDRRSGPGG